MASSTTTFLCLFLILGLASPSLAVDIIVGGNLGWNVGSNLNVWASTLLFRVGDILHFHYVPLVHNVVRLYDEASLLNCIIDEPLSIDGSGHTSFALDLPGDYFFTSSLLTDCLLGLKLKVTVDDV